MTNNSSTITFYDRLAGVLFGTAVGDAIGLPAEGMSRQRLKKIYHGKWRHKFFFHSGMISDDTEHTIFVSQCLLAHAKSPYRFGKRFSWCLRWWLLSLPAGVGFATLRAILKLWVGFSYRTSGVFSAGNGPAMRAAIIGAYFYNDQDTLFKFIEASTKITHTDPRALTGSRAVALLTAWSIRDNLVEPPKIEQIAEILEAAGEDEEWHTIIGELTTAWRNNLSVSEFTEGLGLGEGITGYIYHTVPVAIYSWYIHFGQFRQCLSAALDCGGDTDTVGAITGALCGSVTGLKNIPQNWLNGIIDWPRGKNLLYDLTIALTQKKQEDSSKAGPVPYCWPAVLFRNILFLAIVLLHGLRRLFPPY